MAGYFELKPVGGSEFMFNLKAANHQVILTSERYSSRAAAEAGIASVKANAASDERFARKTAKDNSPYFVLLAANGQQVGRSEMYASAAAMEAGIASVKANAPAAATKVLEA